jgi:hypothetical protein
MLHELESLQTGEIRLESPFEAYGVAHSEPRFHFSAIFLYLCSNWNSLGLSKIENIWQNFTFQSTRETELSAKTKFQVYRFALEPEHRHLDFPESRLAVQASQLAVEIDVILFRAAL